MFDVITIGAATRDLFLISRGFKTVSSKKFSTGEGECVALGSKIEVEKLILTTGGGATNAAATFASLGFKTAALARVGDDASSDEVKAELKHFGVSTELLRTVKNGQTAFGTQLTMPDGERSVLIFRGVSASFSDKDIPLSKLTSKWIYLTSLGGNVALARKVIEFASSRGAFVAWNPGRPELEKGLRALLPIFPFVHVLNMNREEAALLTGKSSKNIKTLAGAFSLDDDQILVVTDGERGAYIKHEGKLIHVGTTGAKSKSRTGAGDAFGSGFVVGLMKTEDIEAAAKIGVLNAESVIQEYGAKQGILRNFPSEKKMERIKIFRMVNHLLN